MARIEKTVFISYRRTNYWTALAIFQNLDENGYDVFLDYQSIPSGDFEQVIIENIQNRAHFIVLLSPSALERCNEPGDWLRREIEAAIDNKRNIIPIMMEGFDFGNPTTVKALTGKLADLGKYNAMSIPAEYFNEAMAKLRSERFLNRPLESVSHPVSHLTRQVTQEQKSAAQKAAKVNVELLTAQEWFERGNALNEAKKYDQAIHCFTEAVRLDPDFSGAYHNLGNILIDLERYKDAEAAYRKAIEVDPSEPFSYSSLGGLLIELKRYKEAETAYRRAIELGPWFDYFYIELGNLLIDLKRYKEAEAVFRKALEFSPSSAQAHHLWGDTLVKLKRYEEALGAYRRAKDIDPSDADAYIAIASINRQLGRNISDKYIEKVRQYIPYDDWYTLTRLASASGHFDLAFESLQKAARRRGFDRVWAWSDPDLQWIRNDPRFTKIVGPRPD